jgi:hypothetical protein
MKSSGQFRNYELTKWLIRADINETSENRYQFLSFMVYPRRATLLIIEEEHTLRVLRILGFDRVETTGW